MPRTRVRPTYETRSQARITARNLRERGFKKVKVTRTRGERDKGYYVSYASKK